MKRIYSICRACLGVSILVLFCGCASSGYNKGQFNIITLSQEADLGQKFASQIDEELRSQGMGYHDTRVIAYLENLGQRLANYAPEKNFNYRFRVVNNPEVNAFALPAGYIYVNTGLIQEADNEAELAGVLSHEIGHVVARHWAERYSAMFVAAMAAQVLIETRESETDRIIAELASELVITGGALAYSRANEREADRLAVYTMYEAGYHPEAMASFFRKLQEMTGDMSRFQVLLSTHPDPKDRVAWVYEIIETLPGTSDLAWNSMEFNRIKNIISRTSQPEQGRGRGRGD
jgi:predicted Zn-dependent protease